MTLLLKIPELLSRFEAKDWLLLTVSSIAVFLVVLLFKEKAGKRKLATDLEDEQQHAPIEDDSITDLRKRKLIAQIKALETRESKTTRLWNSFANVQTWTLLLAIAAACWGAWQYLDQAENEYKKPFWEKQLEFYLQATEATATLNAFIKDADPKREDADPTRRQKWNEASMKFWQLYYGQLAVLADPKVRDAMVAFGKCLRERERELGCTPEQLKELSLSLANECRKSVSNSWKEPLGEVSR